MAQAIDNSDRVVSSIAPDVDLIETAVDERLNAVRLYVLPGQKEKLVGRTSAVTEALGVPVVVDEEPAGRDVGCSSRENCTGELYNGASIRRGSASLSNLWRCTTGFQVWSGTDVQLLTAGHCGWGTPQTWFHRGYSLTNAMFVEVGDNTNGTLYRAGGKDVMRTYLPAGWETTSIYGENQSIDMQQDAVPLQGEAIWFSGAATNAVVAGTVTSAWTHWTSEHCNCTVYGGKASWTPVVGDSGAPVYSKYYSGTPYPRYVTTPKGINDHQNGGFARVFDATVAWNLTMYGQ